MSLQDWASVATIIGALSIPLSAVFVWMQLRQQNALTKVANTQSLVELSSPFNLELIKDRQMAEFWIQGRQRFDGYDPVDQYRFKSLLIWWLILHENIYFQWQQKLLDQAVFQAWQYDLDEFARDQLRGRWEELRPAFQADFAVHIDRILKKADEQRRDVQADSQSAA
jgi:hypothetical protein